MGYFTISREGQILEVNLTGAKMLERERVHLMNSKFGFFITDLTKPVFNLFLDQVYRSKGKASCDVDLATNGNLPVSVHLTGIADETGKQSFVTLIDISERIKAEEEMKESGERYRLLADHMTDLVWLMDMDFKVTYQSPLSEKLRGFTSVELINLPLEKNMAPESLKQALELFYKEIPLLIADPLYNPISNLELEYYKSDGTTCWLENRFSIIRNNTGEPVSILDEGRDITKRRKMEQAIKENEARALAFLTAIPDMIFMLNRQGVFLYY